MAATPSVEARELSLLDKVELRIASAGSDIKLQTVLSTYLSPILLKLGSEHISVRNKVISICQHINSRITPQSIQLPVVALLKQFKDNPNVPLIRHFDLLYIQKGITRLPTSELAALLPVLCGGIAKDAALSALHGASLFHFLLRSLSVAKLPLKGTPEDNILRETLGLSDDDAIFLSLWFGKVILLRVVAGSTNGPTSTSVPGLSQDEYAFLTLQGKSETWNHVKSDGLNLTETRSRVLAFLSSGAFASQERFLPALFASAEPAPRIADVGEDMLKRALPNIDLDDQSLVGKLYDIYFSYYTSSEQNANQFVPAVRVPVRCKIINILSKSQTSTTFPDRVRRLAEKDLTRDDENMSPNDREVLKLRSAIVAYLGFVSRRASKTDLDVIAQPLIRALQTYVERQGEDSRGGDFRSLRGSTYEIIGQLAAANRSVLLERDLPLLRWLFQSLSEETDRDVVVSVDGALSATLRCFQGQLDQETEDALRLLLLRVMSEQSNNSRNLQYAVLRFANRCLAYNDVVARYLDFAALASQPSHDMAEEAKKGLDPYWYSMYQSTNDSDDVNIAGRSDFPDFAQLVKYVFDETRISSLPMSIQAMAVQYARQALMWAALRADGQAIEVNTEWERKLDLAALQDQKARTSIRLYLQGLATQDDNRQALAILWQTAIKGILAEQQTTDRAQCARVVVELCTFCPPRILHEMSSYTSQVEGAVVANDIELRTLAAQAYGLLMARRSDVSVERLEGLLSHVSKWNTAVGADVNKAHGSALALSSFICHRLYLQPDDSVAEELLGKVIPHLLSILDKATDTLLNQASFVSIGMLCQYFVIDLNGVETHLSFNSLLEKILKWAKAGNEKAIHALGYLAMILDEDKDEEKIKTLLDKMRELHEIRQAETQFAVGEALVSAACGWESTALLPTLDVEGLPPSGPARQSILGLTLDRTLVDSTNTKPALKKAAVIWLLCFVQFCGERMEVNDRLRKLQVAFKRCLSDRDELVQEAASRGLGLVYEKGDQEIQDELVRDLVGSFSSDRANIAGTISEDTQLFEAGALPTGEGQSVTTYKDIMSLASEVGDSSLVYRFMSLASNNAIWSSRAAFGRFGLSNVLSGSGVNDYLAANPKLYPKLFRYRFDPNSNVRRSMNDIWNALIKDTNATINQHFVSIMEDLLQNILAREWRVRQASCAAIADLVQGRKFEQISPYLDRVWSLCFKVLDDIKESVRSAAAELSRVLIGILLRTLESSDASTESSKGMLRSVLPFLLSTQGLESSAKETQMVSIHTILEIIKKANGNILRPFIPELVESLLGLLTSFEGEAVNYLHLNASKYGVTEQKIDEMRLTNIRGSPLMEAIERCLDLLDEDTMKALSTRLQTSMRSAVGMPSKVGCSRVLVSLSTRRNFLFQPYADNFLDVIPRHCLKDRNEMVMSSYAASLGYIARSASDDAILKLATHASKLYFESDDDRSRTVAGEIVRAVARHATDRFASLAAAFLPLIFTARNDENADVKQLFKETWDDNTGGSRAASLYLREIVALANEHLTSKRWVIKHGAALAVAEATDAVSAARGSGPFSEAEAALIWPALKVALAEKSWEGKEKVLSAFSTFVKDGSGFWKTQQGLSSEIVKIALREAGRRNAKYRPHALTTLGNVAAVDDMPDMFEKNFQLLESTIGDMTDSKEELADDHAESDELRQQTLAAAVTALFQSIRFSRNSIGTDDIPEGRCLKVLDLAKRADDVALTLAQKNLAVFHIAKVKGLKAWLDTWLKGQSTAGTAPPVSLTHVISRMVSLLHRKTATALPEDTRVLYSEAYLGVARLLQRCGGSEIGKTAPDVKAQLESLLAEEPSQTVRRNLTDAVETVTKLL